MSYKSKFTGVEIERRLDLVIDVLNELQKQLTEIESKQDIVIDLLGIREGAAKGETALQSVPEEYVTEQELLNKDYSTRSEIQIKLDLKQDTISDLSAIRNGANKGATAVQPSAISDMETKTNAAATYQLKITDSNKLDYNLINGTPTLLSNVSQLINDAEYVSATDTDDTEVDDVEAVYVTETLLESELEKKQDKLVSGTNIRTINGTSVLGGGDIEIKNDNADILNLVYPIGSIYLSVNEVNPSTLFGFGEWEMIKDTFLLGAGDTYAAGSTGGSATHTLTADEMPSHAHTLVTATSNGGSSWDCPPARQLSDWWDLYNMTNTTGHSGGDQPHNNMPPYLTVYIWKRIN